MPAVLHLGDKVKSDEVLIQNSSACHTYRVIILVEVRDGSQVDIYRVRGGGLGGTFYLGME